MFHVQVYKITHVSLLYMQLMDIGLTNNDGTTGETMDQTIGSQWNNQWHT